MARTRIFEYHSLPGSTTGETGGGMRPEVEVERRLLQLEQQSGTGQQSEIDRLTEQLQAQKADHALQLETVRALATQAGQAAAEQEGEQRLQEKLDRVSGLMKALDRETHGYLIQVEREVVELALDIARRIMKHEAQMDPLFLAGAVRVALEAMRDGSEILIRVPEKDIARWEEILRGTMLGKRKVTVEGDARMGAGECTCKLSTGMLDLGVRAQLSEVERTFESLLGRRAAQLPRDGFEADPITVKPERREPVG